MHNSKMTQVCDIDSSSIYSMPNYLYFILNKSYKQSYIKKTWLNIYVRINI